MPSLVRLHYRAIAAALTLAVLVAGCGDDSPETAATTTTSSATTSTTDPSSATMSGATSTSSENPTSTASTVAAGSEEELVVDRYLGYWQARFAANSGTPNPEDPALREFATGAQLDAVIAETRENLEQGLIFREAPDPHNFQQVRVVSTDGDTAVVQECVVSDGLIVRADTGEVVNDDVSTQNVRGELLRVDGTWRVSAVRLVQSWEGVAGCALGS